MNLSLTLVSTNETVFATNFSCKHPQHLLPSLSSECVNSIWNPPLPNCSNEEHEEPTTDVNNEQINFNSNKNNNNNPNWLNEEEEETSTNDHINFNDNRANNLEEIVFENGTLEVFKSKVLITPYQIEWQNFVQFSY